MNLARVEHYFSDWLSCTESRRYRDDAIIQQAVPLHRASGKLETIAHRADGSTEKIEVPSSLPLPTNLVVSGTVNVDESTFGFSPKVLDRAMVLEFDEVDLDRLRNRGANVVVGGYRLPDKLAPYRLATSKDYERLPTGTHDHIVAINKILEQARLHIGYRSANELALFILIYNDMLPIIPEDSDLLRALDAAILQKILPKIAGNRAKIEFPLAKLCGYLKDLAVPSVFDFDANAAAKLPKSYRRSIEMLSALRDFGFVSFFK